MTREPRVLFTTGAMSEKMEKQPYSQAIARLAAALSSIPPAMEVIEFHMPGTQKHTQLRSTTWESDDFMLPLGLSRPVSS